MEQCKFIIKFGCWCTTLQALLRTQYTSANAFVLISCLYIPKYLQPGIVRGQWDPAEDQLILNMVSRGFMWRDIAPRLPGRMGETVRGRYVNHLDPSLKKSKWTKEEDNILFENQRKLGNKWSEIRKLLPGRSDNSIKNRYHNRKTAYFRKIQKFKKNKARNNFMEASAKAVKEKGVGSVNSLKARPAPLILEDFPDAVVGI